MPYRRRPQLNRRYFHSEPDSGTENLKNSYNVETSTLGSIPMPNESERAPESVPDPRKAHKMPSILGFLKGHIHLEEIILLALIFLLLEEGIDDEFLLILLIYILLG